MPGYPNECRQHAANCKRLAEEATTPEARKHFSNLAAQWERLAAELESTRAFLDAMAQIDEPKRPSEFSTSTRAKSEPGRSL
jgi:hypothetical protein